MPVWSATIATAWGSASVRACCNSWFFRAGTSGSSTASEEVRAWAKPRAIAALSPPPGSLRLPIPSDSAYVRIGSSDVTTSTAPGPST